jgi:hypothetical protein
MGNPIPASARYQRVGAVVIVAAILGACAAGYEPNPTPTPTPTATPTPPPVLVGDALEPGTYTLVGTDIHATITVPAGWSNLGGWGVQKGDDDARMVVGYWSFEQDFAHVYTDPCHWSGNEVDPPVGQTVDDLADALAAQLYRGDGIPTDVTIDGYRGKYVELSVPNDADFSTCDEGQFRSWEGRYHQGPGQIDRVYILGVDGRRVVIIDHHMPAASAADLAEQQAVVDSIDFLP